MSNEETVYNIQLSYSEIETLLYALYNQVKHDLVPESEQKKSCAVNAKLRESRCFENVAGVQS